MVFGPFRKNISYVYNKNDKEDSKRQKKDLLNNVGYGASDFIKTEFEEEIDKHFLEIFPDRFVEKLDDDAPETVSIDIRIMYPTDEESFYVLYTSGMSALPMNIPDGIKKEYPELTRSELFMLLPSTWNIKGLKAEYPKEEDFWPVKLLRMMGHYPHEFLTWFGPGHSIGISNEYQTFAKNTKLCSAMLVALGDDISIIKGHNDTLISSHLVLPLYREEMEYKLKAGYDALLNRYAEEFNQDDGTQWIVDINRKNVCL